MPSRGVACPAARAPCRAGRCRSRRFTTSASIPEPSLVKQRSTLEASLFVLCATCKTPHLALGAGGACVLARFEERSRYELRSSPSVPAPIFHRDCCDGAYSAPFAILRFVVVPNCSVSTRSRATSAAGIAAVGHDTHTSLASAPTGVLRPAVCRPKPSARWRSSRGVIRGIMRPLCSPLNVGPTLLETKIASPMFHPAKWLWGCRRTGA